MQQLLVGNSESEQSALEAEGREQRVQIARLGAWGPERPIYGTIRYMSYASTSRKFDSAAYIARMQALGEEGTA